MALKTVSCGVLVFNPAGELLLGHATGSARWDIPKGIAEDGETPRSAVLRETAEETGLQLPPDALVEVGRFVYLRGKDLALFAAVVDGLDPARCVCTSAYTDHRGRVRLELDAFRWLAWHDVPQHCGRSLAGVLAAIDPAAVVQRCRPVVLDAGSGRAV